MTAINVVVLMDEDLLTELERLPANKVLAVIEASTEQVRSAVEYIREGIAVPEQLAAMVFHIDELKILSSVENHGSKDPRTGVETEGQVFIINRFSYMGDGDSVIT